MDHEENQEITTQVKGRKTTFMRTGKIVGISLFVIALVYLFMNPQELKNGKALAKKGNHQVAISEFVKGIAKYENNDFSGGRRIRSLQRLTYKVNLANFFYNKALSYEALGKPKTDNTFIYYGFALEAYNEVLLLKENHEKVIKAKEQLENEFIELFGKPYMYGMLSKSKINF